MVMFRRWVLLRDPLKLDGILEHHALIELANFSPEDILPRGLAFGDGIPALRFQLVTPFLQLVVGDQDVHRSLVEVDSQTIPVFENG